MTDHACIQSVKILNHYAAYLKLVKHCKSTILQLKYPEEKFSGFDWFCKNCLISENTGIYEPNFNKIFA